MLANDLKRHLCKTFCNGISVNAVPVGYAISSAFEDSSGDKVSFYLTESDDGFLLQDDGSYLATLIAKDIPVDQGQRGNMLNAILAQGNAYWDKETYEIKSNVFAEQEISRRTTEFLSSLLRVRDLELLTKDIVRSTFREDATSAIHQSFDNVANISPDEAVSSHFSEFPADLIIRPRERALESKVGVIYFVNSNDKLNEALLLKMEADTKKADFEVIALLEEPQMKQISHKKFQRAQNRSLNMPIFRGDESASMNYISNKLRISNAA